MAAQVSRKGKAQRAFVPEQQAMKQNLVLSIVFIALVSPSIASSRHYRTDRDKPAVSRSQITCDVVRAFVAQAGLARAKAMAAAAGMTASEERRAMRCLKNSV
jgi:hypothetical protein